MTTQAEGTNDISCMIYVSCYSQACVSLQHLNPNDAKYPGLRFIHAQAGRDVSGQPGCTEGLWG
jgi:hypothetical protein